VVNVPERLVWAVETLQVQPADRLLEIGCGPGHAISLVCERLDGGTVTAIDRSEVAIRAARERNLGHAATGKASFLRVALADADFGNERFDKIFAINVNVFWLEPARELAVIRRLLSPDGALYLFYQPPTAAKAREVAGRVSGQLAANGLTVAPVLVRELSKGVSVCVKGWLTTPSRG
jgi:SAM-dependent methyltransferase